MWYAEKENEIESQRMSLLTTTRSTQRECNRAPIRRCLHSTDLSKNLGLTCPVSDLQRNTIRNRKKTSDTSSTHHSIAGNRVMVASDYYSNHVIQAGVEWKKAKTAPSLRVGDASWCDCSADARRPCDDVVCVAVHSDAVHAHVHGHHCALHGTREKGGRIELGAVTALRSATVRSNLRTNAKAFPRTLPKLSTAEHDDVESSLV